MLQKTLNTLIQTDGQNSYYVSRSHPGVLLLHPVLKHLIALKEKNQLTDWLATLPVDLTEPVQIDQNTTVPRETILYYHKYLHFLEEKGYFDGVEKYPLPPNRYKASDIKTFLSNNRQIVFEVTESCNLKCRYCGFGEFYHDYAPRENKNLDLTLAKQLLDYMIELFQSPSQRQYFRKKFISFYGGEPLLNMAFIEEIVAYVKNKPLKFNQFAFSMTTNGLLLHKYMDFLVANDFSLSISLDGNEQHNQYRSFADGSPSYQTVYNNVLALREKYPDYFKTSVNFLTVVHDKNSLNEVNQFFEREFQKLPFIMEINPLGIKPGKRDEYEKIFKRKYAGLTDKDFLNVFQSTDKLLNSPLVDSLWHFLGSHSGYVYRRYDTLLQNQKLPWVVRTGTCNPFERKLFITAKGKILPCERVQHVYELGSIDKKGLNLDFEAIAEQMNQYYENLMSQCNHCAGSDSCSNCIFNINILDQCPQCSQFSQEEHLYTHLQRQLSLLEEMPRYYPTIMKNYQVS